LLALLLTFWPTASRALVAGDPAPDFALPWLDGGGELLAEDVFSRHDLTALVFWNRGCPHCTELALSMNALADSLERIGVGLCVIAFGPEDPQSLREFLREHHVTVPHLWDADGRVAAAYGLGRLSLSSFLIDRDFIVRAAFDDEVPGLAYVLLPAAREVLAERAASEGTGPGAPPPSTTAPAVPGSGAAPPSSPTSRSRPDAEHRPAEGRYPPLSLSSLRYDVRMRLLSTEGVQEVQASGAGVPGLFGEELHNGALLLWRADLRFPLRVARGIELEPWLRLGNEDAEALSQGAEQWSNERGTVSLRGQWGGFAAALGAYPIHMSPLLLQRWDDEDAPPLGGVNSCGCGAGVAGLSQGSLEVLGPDYTFEGASAAYTHRYARLRGWFAVPRWEKEVLQSAPSSERGQERYRRLMEGALVSIGPIAREDRETELPSPLGLGAGILHVGDDNRTVSREPGIRQPEEGDEIDYLARLAVGPFRGLTLEGQQVWSKLVRDDLEAYPPQRHLESNSRAHLLGARGRLPLGRLGFWARAHHLRTGEGFQPLYRALTYDPNREGWRFTAGAQFFQSPEDKNERLGILVFYRRLHDVSSSAPEDTVESAATTYTVASLTFLGRPHPELLAEAHLVRTVTDHPGPFDPRPDLEARGLSLDFRYDGWPSVDPVLRLDWIRPDEDLLPAGGNGSRNVFQGSLWVRVLW